MRSLMILLMTFLLVACGDDTSTTPEEAKPVAKDIRSEIVTYKSGGVLLRGYLVYDAAIKEKRPGVIVVHEWWGHNQYVRDRAHMLAELGYTAFALDMYGDGRLARHPKNAKKFMMKVLNNMREGERRFKAARDYLESHQTTLEDKTAAIGYCFGGGVVLHMARKGSDLKGVASFHGSLATKTPAKAGDINTKILVLHGADDPFVKPEHLDGFKTEMKEAGADMKFVSYPGAVHSFTRPDVDKIGEEFNLPLAYNEEADMKSWKELQGFLKRVFSQ